MTKVSLYTRDRQTRQYHTAKPNRTYPVDTIWVLRIGSRWETLDGMLTYYEAAAKASAKKTEILLGVPQKAKAEPKSKAPEGLKALIDAYLKSIREHRSHKTWLAYSLALHSFLKSCECATVGEITEDVLKKFVSASKKEKLSARTIANRLANVVCFLKEHDSDVSITHKYTEKTVKAYRPDEVRAFFQACLKYHPELWLQFQFFLCTGAREQEVMNAEYGDIDFKDNLFTVTEKPNWRPKDFEEREIPIPAELVEALRERQKTATSKLIFPTPSGKPNGHMLRQLQAVVAEAGLSGHWELHKYRKTYATLQARDGVDVKVLQQRLGHSDLETTISYLEGEDARSERSQTQVTGTFGKFWTAPAQGYLQAN